MNRFLLSLIVLFLFSYGHTTILDVPDDYGTIQGGIDAAVAGDTILVADGHYYERITFKGKAINVVSNYLLDGDTMHIRNTIIDGDTSYTPMTSDTGSVVRFVNGEDSTSMLIGFTIRGGIGTPRPFSWSAREFLQAGGGIFKDLYSGSPTITHCVIRDNKAEHGGGVWLLNAGIRSCTIIDNEGGGIAGTGLSIDTCIIMDNDGWGIESIHSSQIEHSIIDGNETGIYCHSYFYKDGSFADKQKGAVINNCEIRNNTGRGIWVWENAVPVITDCLIKNNTGGGIGFGNFEAGIGFSMTGCEISGNSAQYGGGIYYNTTDFGDISYCTFFGNSAVKGGVFYVEASKAEKDIIGEFSNCTFAKNIADSGSVIYLYYTYIENTILFENSIFAFNSGGPFLVCSDWWIANYDMPVFDCTDIFGNEGGDWIDIIADQYGINGNFSGDPLFCDTAGNDFHLYSKSPCAPDNSPEDCGLIGALPVNCSYICGDANNDGSVNISDAVCIINYVFLGGSEPVPYPAGDCNCDGVVDISDALVLINYIFIGGYAPCDPDDNGEPDC